MTESNQIGKHLASV